MLNLLNRQSVLPHEIIVIDSESDDGTAERAQEAGVRVMNVCRSEFDHGGTRNMAAAAASGDILLFMTQDAMPKDEKLIEKLIEPLLSQENVVYAYARQQAYPDADTLETMARLHNYPPESQIKSYEDVERMGIKAFFCSNVCSAIRKSSFEAMGKFQAPVIFNEDLFMSARCILSGYKVAYCAEAVVFHSHNYSVIQQLKRYFDNGVSMRCNAWILPYSGVGKAGSGLVKRQLSELCRSGQWLLVPRLIAESAAKLIGYKLGLHFHRLPHFIRRKLSMHRLILTRYVEGNGIAAESNKSSAF